MTPKEEAEKLLTSFDSVVRDYTKGVSIKALSKDLAIITVEKIIKSREDDGHFDDTLSSTSSEYYTPHPMYLTYWEQVKNEIEKL